MSCEEEFKTVYLVANSTAETRGVDAFALSLIKAERQLRKLFTHLIFQFPCFSKADIPKLRDTLAQNRRVYFDGFLKGFNALYQKTAEDLIGNDYQQLRERISKSIEHRNKIFHGQLTKNYLSREELLLYVSDIGLWCKKLADSCLREFGYDGFARDSFRKSQREALCEKFKVSFQSVADYEGFVRQHMERCPNQPFKKELGDAARPSPS